MLNRFVHASAVGDDLLNILDNIPQMVKLHCYIPCYKFTATSSGFSSICHLLIGMSVLYNALMIFILSFSTQMLSICYLQYHLVLKIMSDRHLIDHTPESLTL